MGNTYSDIHDFQILQRDVITNSAIVDMNGVHITLKTGGPYEINGIKEVYVGDIWVMAGQSNMRGHGFLKQAYTGINMSHALVPRVHLFDSEEKWRLASDPTHQLALSPREVHHTLADPTVRNPEIIEYRGASLGLSFGRKYQALNDDVPVGLIASAHGGVTLKQWERPPLLTEESYNTTLYGAMIDRIRKVGGNIAGVLWYQGESDAMIAEDAASYQARFQFWLDVLRSDTRYDLPVAFVQLGPHRLNIQDIQKQWNEVQEHQRKVFGYKSITAGVSSIDCSLDDKVHISASGLNKIGERLAIAASMAMKGRADLVSPMCGSATYEEIVCIPSVLTVRSIKIEFSNLDDDQWVINDNIVGFAIHGYPGDVLLVNTQVEQDRKTIRIYLETNIPPPPSAYISYGVANQHVNLITEKGLGLPVHTKIPITKIK
ncbi:SGNH hydrolase-type esterase domain-containing protein [Pilobolus umbonatus]|nr:SGNH hydrolase-type esterase domain-containing protein [Pilobolus umbonatus]